MAIYEQRMSRNTLKSLKFNDVLPAAQRPSPPRKNIVDVKVYSNIMQAIVVIHVCGVWGCYLLCHVLSVCLSVPSQALQMDNF